MMTDAFYERLRELLRILRAKEVRLSRELLHLSEENIYGQREVKIIAELYQISMARRFALEYAETK